MHFFRQFQRHNSGTEHGNQTNDPIFFIYFFHSNCLEHSFLNLKVIKIHFYVVPPFGPFQSVKYLTFFYQKLPIRTRVCKYSYFHTFLESRHSEVTKNLCCVFPNTHFFGSSSWTINCLVYLLVIIYITYSFKH